MSKQPIALQEWNSLTHVERQEKKKPIVRSTEAATLLGVSSKSVQRWADAGLLRPIMRSAGKHRRFTRIEIERFRKNSVGEPKCPHCGKTLARPREESSTLEKPLEMRQNPKPEKRVRGTRVKTPSKKRVKAHPSANPGKPTGNTTRAKKRKK